MRSKEYWQKRFEAVLLAAERQGNDLVRELNAFYEETTRIILQDVDAFYGRYADKNGITIQEAKKRITATRLDSFHQEMERYYAEVKRLGLGKDYEEYLRRLSARGYVSRQEELMAQVRHQVELLANRELESFLGTLGETYEHSYYRTIFDTQQGLGFGMDFNRMDSRAIEQVIRRPWLGESFSDRIWKQKGALLEQLDRIIPQAFATGQNSRILGQRLAKQMNTSRYNGERLARTEVNHAANEATRAAYKEFGVEQYEFLATLDNRTSELCAALDGKVFRLTDAQTGTNYPPMHPNCRSTTVPYFEPDEFDQPAKRAARDANGKYYTVPADMTFSQWKKQLESGTMIVKSVFVAATTLKEAEAYAREHLGIPHASYKGCDLETANAWNEGLHDTFQRFPELRQNFGFVGEAHERNKMIKPVVKDYYLEQFRKAYPQYTDAQLMPSVEKQVQAYMRNMAVGENTMAQSYTPHNTLFDQFRGISVNRDYGKDHQHLLRAVQSDVAAKFHPVGCDTIRSVLDHEIGHQLDDWLSVSQQKSIQALYDRRTNKDITEDLSRYSWDHGSKKRYAEMIAEGWAEYCNNPSPRPMAKEIGEAIERLYEEWKRNNT